MSQPRLRWWPPNTPERTAEILSQAASWYGGRITRLPDDRLTVSADVMACLENDYPEVAALFQVHPVLAELERAPVRWVAGIEPENVPDGWELRQ